jgi:hypothetical protein
LIKSPIECSEGDNRNVPDSTNGSRKTGEQAHANLASHSGHLDPIGLGGGGRHANMVDYAVQAANTSGHPGLVFISAVVSPLDGTGLSSPACSIDLLVASGALVDPRLPRDYDSDKRCAGMGIETKPF